MDEKYPANWESPIRSEKIHRYRPVSLSGKIYIKISKWPNPNFCQKSTFYEIFLKK